MRNIPSSGQFLATLLCTLATLVTGCKQPVTPVSSKPAPIHSTDSKWVAPRERMVAQQLAARGIRNERLLAAMGRVPRHEFVPEDIRPSAYDDGALPIGYRQTISQPYVVAFMTEAIDPQPGQRVLEVGTGSGYQAAILAELVGEVYTIELIPELAEQAKERLNRLAYRNVHVRTGDGYLGWPGHVTFDAVVLQTFSFFAPCEEF